MANSVTSNRALTEDALYRSMRAVQPLALTQSSLTTALVLDAEEQALIRDRIHQGQSINEVAIAVFEHRFNRLPNLGEALPASSLRASLRPEVEDGVSDGDRLQQLRTELEAAFAEYRREVLQEFNSIRGDVQVNFGKNQRIDAYLELRPKYYAAGYKTPVEQVFNRIQPYTFLGHRIVGGVHEAMAQKLDQARTHLETWKSGLSAEIGKQFSSIAGFVPRTMRGSETLSNHTFGLSIDIDPSTNPHIKGEVVPVLNEIVKASGFEYGKRFVEPDPAMKPEDWANQTHEAASKASDLVRAWLQKHLPRYRERMATIQQSDAILKAPTSTAAQKTAAQEAKAKAQQELQTDEELKRMPMLVKHHGAYLDRWAAEGIQTIPAYLAMALAKAGLRWGQTYGSHKDGMHFELLVEDVIPKSP